MAITIIAQPNEYHPAYNPVVYQLSSNNSSVLSFRYIYDIWTASPTSTFLTRLRIAPEVNGTGKSDISKILQTQINQKLVFNSEIEDLTDIKLYEYEIRFGEEYSEFTSFTDYEFGGYWVRLTGTGIDSMFNIGDTVYIQLDDQTITDNRKILNGYHTVVDSGTDYIEIDVLYSSVGDGPATPGNCYFADRRKVIDTELETVDGKAYNEAVPFKDWVSWNESLILPTNDEEPQGDILTNSPNWLETSKEKDKYIIKTYQQLYWNAMNNPASDFEFSFANTMIVQNEFGDKWMLVNYTNWDDGDIRMRQFDISPNNQNWINITPNFGNTAGYQYGLNPYTHITPTGELRESRYLDYWTTFAPGNDDCDEIGLYIQLDPTPPGPPTEDYYFTARPVGRGFNGRRIYSTIIDDKPAVIWSDILSPTVRNWKITFTNANPIQPASQYQSFATRTSNSLPFGQSYAINNSADAWKAFDGNPTTFYQTTDNSGVATITYNFSTGAIRWADIQSYTINKGGALSNAPRGWAVEASQNGSTWTIIHTVSGNSTNATYNSPQLFGTTKWNYVRLVVNDTIPPVSGPTNVRIFEFSINSSATVATMISGSNCPVNTPFTPWTWTGPNPPVGMDATVLETIAIGPFTFPTLKRRRVYLDYDCEINSTQLLFLDRAGSYSSFVFPLRVEEAGTNQKLSYKNEIGFIEDGQWTYNTYDSESTVYNSIVEKTYKLTTDWLNTSMSDYFEELITSPEVYIKLNSEVDNGRDGDGQPSPWLACTVLDSAFINPKQKNKRLINRTITVKLNSNNPINI